MTDAPEARRLSPADMRVVLINALRYMGQPRWVAPPTPIHDRRRPLVNPGDLLVAV